MTMRLFLFLFSFFFSLAHAQEFLDPAVAFKPSVKALDGQTIELSYEIAKGYYLYRNAFRVVVDGEGATLGALQIPKGKEKDDENFGKVEVYYKSVAIRVPVERNVSGVLPLKLKVTSQGCADAGVCYPPQTQAVSLELPDPASTPSINAAPAGEGDESGRIAAALKDAGFWANLAFFFLAGLGLSLTPCVFPMIPILSGIIAGQGHKVTRGRGFALALTYVLGMAVTYSAAGIAAGMTGTLLAAALQSPWVLGGFALVFVVLSFSMFGFYESALIVGPCVAAPLAGALLYIGQTGDAVFGGAALFVMALGMGVPLIIVGLSAGTLLPKAGAWMEAVKKAFGVLLLATAVWLISPVIPAVAQMLAWAALLIIPAIYLHALDPLPPHAKGWQRFWKGIGIVMLLTGAALLIGALAGGRDPLQPLAGLRGQAKLAGFKLLKADVTANSTDDKALLARFGLFGPPGILFFDKSGKEIKTVRVVGFQDAATFMQALNRAEAAG